MNDATPIEPGIGHNLPPLAEQLAEEVASFRERRDALLESLRNSKIASPEDAAAVTTLGGMFKELRDRVETARKAAAEPFDTGKATNNYPRSLNTYFRYRLPYYRFTRSECYLRQVADNRWSRHKRSEAFRCYDSTRHSSIDVSAR